MILLEKYKIHFYFIYKEINKIHLFNLYKILLQICFKMYVWLKYQKLKEKIDILIEY